MENMNMQAIMDNYVVPWGLNIVLALLIFFVGKAIVGLLVRITRKLLEKAKMDAILIDFLGSILHSVLLLFVIIAALDRLGVNTNSMLALIGAAGIAIGLALQNSLQNFAAGVMLILFRPFKAGDFIEAAGIAGVVERISIFSSTLRTGDNREVIVPNGAIYSGSITNFSARDTRRIDMVVGIGYDSDLRKAREILQGLIDADARILQDPAPLIAVSELAESSVNFVVRPWVAAGDYWPVRFDLTEKIKLEFDANGISIPYPQMDVHLQQTA